MLVHPMEKIEISIDYSIYLLPKIHLFADSLKKKTHGAITVTMVLKMYNLFQVTPSELV